MAISPQAHPILAALSEAFLDLEPESSSKRNYYSRCPSCTGKISIRATTGAWRCFVCEEKGSAKKLASMLKLEGYSEAGFVPPAEEQEEAKGPTGAELQNVWDSLKPASEYLKTRGLGGEAVGDLSSYVRLDDFRNAIVFAYRDANGAIAGLKYRQLDPAASPKYFIRGKADLFPAPPGVNGTTDVFVTEGEFDSLSLIVAGQKAVALGGVSQSNKLKQLIDIPRVYIAFDRDEEPNVRATVAKQEEAALALLGAAAHVVDTPAKDVNELLKSVGVDGVRQWAEARRRDVIETAAADVSIRLQDAFGDLMEYLANPNAVKGTATGIEALDKLLGGGLRPGEILGVHAEAKVGKSTFVHQIMHSWLGRGLKVGYASRELDPAHEVLPNLLSLELGYEVLTRKQHEPDKYEKAMKKWQLYFSKGYGYFPLEEMRQWISSLRSLGTELFVFDHFHYLLEDEDYKTAATFSRQLKTIAKELKVGIILVIQPTKLGEGQRIGRGTIRGGAAVGQAIDALLVLERVRDTKNVMRVEHAFCRSPLGDLGEFHLQYEKESRKLIEVEYIAEEPEAPQMPQPRWPAPRPSPTAYQAGMSEKFSSRIKPVE